jgi:flagellar biosynthesis/type III secretory pathway M-ring protein FliF/YscJ
MSTGGGFLAMGGGLIEKGLLGLLAAVALGLMFMMTRRTSKKVELPTAEEIVGLPPTLESKSDLIGEAEEGDSPLAGIELDESEVAAQKMLDQVKDLAKTNPDSAANMIKRWVAVEN